MRYSLAINEIETNLGTDLFCSCLGARSWAPTCPVLRVLGFYPGKGLRVYQLLDIFFVDVEFGLVYSFGGRVCEGKFRVFRAVQSV